MNIRILVASDDTSYLERLKDIMGRKTLYATGDVLETAFFTDMKKLNEWLEFKPIRYDRTRYNIALIDESISNNLEHLDNIPVIFKLTADSAFDNNSKNEQSNVHKIYKYQRVSTIINKMLLTFSKLRIDEKIGDNTICAFYSPEGGCGTSTVAAAFALAAIHKGIKPLYISFEHFNSTELFFTDTTDTDQGLYDVFSTLAVGGGVSSAIDVAKVQDPSGIFFLKKFPMWTESAQVSPDEIEHFINSARTTYGTDLVILDLGNGYTQFTERALYCVDEAFVVADCSPNGRLKLNIMFDKKVSFVHEHITKTSLIYNKSESMEQDNPYGFKAITSVPVVSASTPIHLASSIESYIRKLVNPEWKQMKEMN